MFKKVFIVLVGIISILAIVFIGKELLGNHTDLKPHNVFNEFDKQITIINHIDSGYVSDLKIDATKKVEKILSSFDALSCEKYDFYIAASSNKLLIKSDNSWNDESLKRFCSQYGLQLTKTLFNYKTNFGLSLIIKNNYLFIGDLLEQFSTKNKIPNWDQFSNYSIVKLDKSERVEDVYFSTKNSIKYLRYFPVKNVIGRKVNDSQLFIDVLPDKLSDYHFYEKSFANSTKSIDYLSPLNEWCANGFVLFQYEGAPCLISDCKRGVDPFSVLTHATDEDELISGLKNHFKGVKLTSLDGYGFDKEFFIDYIGGRVVVCENKETLRKIVSDYELGRTIRRNKMLIQKIFQHLPTLVSERYIMVDKSYTRSFLGRKVNEVVKMKDLNIPSESRSVSKSKIRFTGKLWSLVAGESLTYVCTDKYELSALRFGKISWQFTFQGEIIGSPLVMDLFNQGQENILLTTSKFIYLLNNNGQIIRNFPIEVKDKPVIAANAFNTKDGLKLFYVSDNDYLVRLSLQGKLEKKVKIDIDVINNPISIFNDNHKTYGIVLNDKEGQRIDLDNLIKLNKFEGLSKGLVFCTSSDNPSFFYFDDKQLIKNSFDGEVEVIGEFPTHSDLQVLRGVTKSYVSFLTKKELVVIEEDGSVYSKIKLPSKGIRQFRHQTLFDGSVIFSLFDTLSNDIYLYTLKGKPLLSNSIKGGEDVVVAQENEETIIVTTLTKDYLIQYRK